MSARSRMVRPGRPNKAASSFASAVVREPLLGLSTDCPVPPEFAVWICSPRSTMEWFLHAATMDTGMLGADRGINPPGRSATVAKMLAALESGKLLGTSGRERALDIMAGQKYHTRLPAKLRPSTVVYHKTGTLSGIINDAGLIYPDANGSGVAVVFLSQNVTSESAAESLAAQVAKTVEQAY